MLVVWPHTKFTRRHGQSGAVRSTMTTSARCQSSCGPAATASSESSDRKRWPDCGDSVRTDLTWPMISWVARSGTTTNATSLPRLARRRHDETVSYNKNQSNFVKGGIAESSRIRRWQLSNLQLHFGWGFDPQISPSPGGQQPPSNTMWYWTLQVYLLNPSSGLSSVHECDRRQTYGKMCNYRRNRLCCKKRFDLIIQ